MFDFEIWLTVFQHVCFYASLLNQVHHETPVLHKLCWEVFSQGFVHLVALEVGWVARFRLLSLIIRSGWAFFLFEYVSETGATTGTVRALFTSTILVFSSIGLRLRICSGGAHDLSIVHILATISYRSRIVRPSRQSKIIWAVTKFGRLWAASFLVCAALHYFVCLFSLLI